MSLNYSNLCPQNHPRRDKEIKRMEENESYTNQEHIGSVRDIATSSKQLFKIIKLQRENFYTQ